MNSSQAHGFSASPSDSKAFNFIVVILAVENLPLLRTFKNNLALRGDFVAGSGVDLCLFAQQRLKRLAGFLADGVAILVEAYLVHFGKSIGNSMRQLIKLVSADTHYSTALYLRGSSFLTFLNLSAYCAPDFRISSE